MKGYCYLICENRTNRFKIGKSINPSQRLKTLQTGNPNKLSLVCRIKTDNMDETEDTLHDIFSHKKTLIGGKEWFILDWDDVATIRSLPNAW